MEPQALTASISLTNQLLMKSIDELDHFGAARHIV